MTEKNTVVLDRGWGILLKDVGINAENVLRRGQEPGGPGRGSGAPRDPPPDLHVGGMGGGVLGSTGPPVLHGKAVSGCEIRPASPGCSLRWRRDSVAGLHG